MSHRKPPEPKLINVRDSQSANGEPIPIHLLALPGTTAECGHKPDYENKGCWVHVPDRTIEAKPDEFVQCEACHLASPKEEESHAPAESV